jgi:two-component system, chemotaxis family, chemotaxis protein CheY
MSKRILLVDDSDNIRRITRLFIESQLDLDVCGEAVDGVDAIEKARELRPDLVVLDLAMPRMNGVKAACQLRAMNSQTPIVLFTMYDDMSARALALSAGVNVVLSKADGGWKLIECVRNLLEAA